MNMDRPTKNCVHLLSVLIMLMVVSCGRSERSQGAIVKVTPLPSGTPPVAYGASLREWEEAAQANGEQTISSNDGRSGETQPDSPLAPVSPLAMPPAQAAEIGTPFTFADVEYRQILWDSLIPADFTAEAIMTKYADQLAAIEDGSPEASELYMKMQQEFDNAPVNEVLNEIPVRLPGFIAPLEYTDDLITEFLLVPYFGACIHVPPPPVNQTVLVKTAKGQGIKIEDSYYPVWVMGKLAVEATTTQLAAAGYIIPEAIIAPYTNQQ